MDLKHLYYSKLCLDEISLHSHYNLDHCHENDILCDVIYVPKVLFLMGLTRKRKYKCPCTYHLLDQCIVP